MNDHIDTFPLVSICIPTYNGEEFLSDALESALSQSYPNLEILISDDSSSDQTLSIADAVCERSKFKFSILHHERLGLVENWNFCIKNAKGKYIKFLFQDDILEPNCISEMVALAEQDIEIGLVFSRRDIFLAEDANSDPGCMMIYEGCQNLHETWSNLQPIQSGQDLLNDPELFKGPINKIGEPTVVLLRREIFDSIGYFDPDFLHLVDVEMWLRIIGHYKIGFIDQSLAAFRVHPKQQTIQNIKSGLVNLDPYRLYAKILYSPAYSFADHSLKQQIISLVDRQINGPLQELRSVSQSLQQTQSQLEQSQSQLEQSQSQLEQSQSQLEQSQTQILAMESSKFWQLRKAWFRLKMAMGIKSNE